MVRRSVVVVTTVAVLAVPGVAGAPNYRAWAGNPPEPPSSAPGGTTINRFLPAKLTIRKGDRVRYSNRGPVPHTVSVLGKGVAPPPLAGPKPGGVTAQGFVAANGQPFYFNGQPLWE